MVKKWSEILNKIKPKSASKAKPKKEEEDNSYLLEGENVSKRNNTRKKFFEYLKKNLKDKEDENAEKELKDKIVEIENKIFESFKGESPYINRVLEILHNLKDEKNDEFRENIINGTIKPEQLCKMSSIDMLSKKKQEEIEKEKERKVDEVRTDWLEKHGQITEGVYKCKKCGGKRTIQHEQQTRSADEPMTLFITCVDCKNTWKG